MAGIAPLFTTAPRIKLKINGTDIAFAIGMNISVSLNVQPVQILGKFGPVSLEPTYYNPVTGTMQIIRLISKEDLQNATDILQDPANASYVNSNVAPVLADKTEGGETIEQTSSAVDARSSNNPLVQNSLIRHMDPRSVLLSTTFDMEMYMRVPDPSETGVTEALDQDNKNDPEPGVLDVNSPNGALKEVPWMTVKDCRITSRNINISQGQLINEPVSFQGIFLTPKTTGENDMFFRDSGAIVNPES